MIAYMGDQSAFYVLPISLTTDTILTIVYLLWNKYEFTQNINDHICIIKQMTKRNGAYFNNS